VGIVCYFIEPVLLASKLVQKMRREKAEHERLSGEIPDLDGRILWTLKAVAVVLFIFAWYLLVGLF
jgi:hypothetical protein